MVDYTTRIIISLKDIEKLRSSVVSPNAEQIKRYGNAVAAKTERIAAMIEILANSGFSLSMKKEYIYADSENIEAVAAKRLLADKGFEDKEYQIYLEYRRQWGVM